MLYSYQSNLNLRGLLNNRAFKFTVDLSSARDDKSLTEEGLLSEKDNRDFTIIAWYYLKILAVGTGNWTLKIHFEDGSSIAIDQGDVSNGDTFTLEYADILFTNTSQNVDNPKFWVETRIIKGQPGSNP